MESGLFKFGRGTPVKLAESSAEMTVAGKTEIEGQSRQVVVVCEEIERPRHSQSQLILVERQALHLLEDLCEVNRRDAHFRGDFG